MSANPSARRLIRFGLFQLDLRSGELLRNGRRVRLQEQSFRVLELLLERPGELVTREELQQRLWPGQTFVDFDDGLNAAVKKLRYALGDSSDNPTFIETVPRRGYRFIAPVMVEGNEEIVSRTEASGPRTRVAVWMGAAAVAIVTIASLALMAPRRNAAAPDGSPIGIVVLPLKNLSNDPDQQYFADGMTEELITRLASQEGLRVISRTTAMQYRNSEKLLPEIASELKVDAVVEGSVLHSDGRVRITAQLIHAATDRHLWAESFERDERDVLQLQNDVALEIAEKVSLKLGPPRVARRVRRIDPEAHRAYLRGRYRWHTRRVEELTEAIKDFERAIAIDPAYALAYAGLADVHLVLPLLTHRPHVEGLRHAKGAAERALQLDPTLAEAHTSFAYAKMYLDWDFDGAERGFRRAIELNPNYATGHQWYAELLSLQGRHEEALAEIEIALKLDPLSAIMHHQAGQSYQQARRYDDAIQEYQNAIAIDPSFERTTAGAMHWAYARKGMAVPAVDSLMKMRATVDRNLFSKLRDAAAAGGVRGFHLKHLELSRGGQPSRAYYPAVVHAAVGHDDQALDWLEKAYQEHDELIFYANVDPEWDRLRSHPRFVAVMSKIGITRARP